MDPRRAPADSSLDAGWITALHTPSALEMADTAPSPNGSRAESDTPVTDDEALGVTRLPREVVASIINFASARSDTLPSSFGSLLELETLHLRDMRRWTLRTSNANAAATYMRVSRAWRRCAELVLFSGINFTRDVSLNDRVRTLAAMIRRPHVGQAVRAIAISLSVDLPTIENCELALALSALRVCAGLQAASLEVSMDPRAGGALLAVVVSTQTLVSLTLAGFDAWTEGDVAAALVACPGLEQLTIAGRLGPSIKPSFTDNRLLATDAADGGLPVPHNGRFNLVTLTVVENGSVSDDLLLHLIDHSPRLTGLALAYSPAASPASLGSLSAVALERALLSCAQRLNSLVCILNRGSVPPDALGAQAGQFDRLLGRVLPSFTELELLSVCDGVVDTSTFLALPKCIRVIRLHVYGVMPVNVQDMLRIAEYNSQAGHLRSFAYRVKATHSSAHIDDSDLARIEEALAETDCKWTYELI